MGFYTYSIKVAQACLLSFALVAPAKAETILVMFESQGCPYCELWKEEIGPIYPKTADGQRAPLMMLDINDDLPDGFNIASSINYTPTFVLLDNGQEVTRLAGYPGDNFFWGLLERMIGMLPEPNTEGSS